MLLRLGCSDTHQDYRFPGTISLTCQVSFNVKNVDKCQKSTLKMNKTFQANAKKMHWGQITWEYECPVGAGTGPKVHPAQPSLGRGSASKSNKSKTRLWETKCLSVCLCERATVQPRSLRGLALLFSLNEALCNRKKITARLETQPPCAKINLQ